MIHAPDTTVDKQLLSYSRELVREAMVLLRRSDHLVSAQRLRDELEQERRSPAAPDQRESRGRASIYGFAADRRSQQMRESEPGGHRQAKQNRGVG